MLSVTRPGGQDLGLFDSQVWTVSPDGSNAIKDSNSDGCNMGDMGSAGDSLPVWAPDGDGGLPANQLRRVGGGERRRNGSARLFGGAAGGSGGPAPPAPKLGRRRAVQVGSSR